MKYSINGFSQAEITKFNDSHPNIQIDPIDILIFTWLKDFIVDTEIANTANKARKKMWTKEIDETKYYRVMYSALIEEFPILNYQSQKTISRRFEKYVEAGILLKKVISAGQGKGSYTFFALTSLFQSFYTNKNNPEQKINPHSKQDIKEDKESTDINNNFREDKNVSSKKDEQFGEDKNVCSNEFGENINVRSFKYILQPSLNSTTTATEVSSEKSQVPDKKESAEAVYLKTLIKLFGFNPNFTPNPYPKIIELFCKYNILEKDIGIYLEWVFGKIKPNCKDVTKLHSYFFKTFPQEPYIANFANIQKQDQKSESQKIKCPICGTIHNKNDLYCPNKECLFERNSILNNDDILKQKKIYFLKTQQKSEYERMQQEIKNLMDKYPLSKRFLNKTMNFEFQKSYNEIEKKYLSGIKVS